MSSKATILALVATLTNNLADQTSAGRIFDETIVDLGLREPNVLTVLDTSLSTVDGVPTVTLPTSVVRVLAIGYEGRMLLEATMNEIQTKGTHWRAHSGEPTAVIFEDTNDRQFRLYPTPVRVAGLQILATQTRATVPDILDLPIALMVCAREFARESPHRDETFAGWCAQFAGTCWEMIP